ncbi:DivIVA domain-containing protein [Cellulomonas hominis]|uniref:DivIVA domain-containing protein n=1 Tax=Cellulomonas hominis TaxID=156981 RepID=A0A7Z8NT27_9CELL|nr:DivIVA domain-containing protein [Cellulomonas hominis]
MTRPLGGSAPAPHGADLTTEQVTERVRTQGYDPDAVDDLLDRVVVTLRARG